MMDPNQALYEPDLEQEAEHGSMLYDLGVIGMTCSGTKLTKH